MTKSDKPQTFGQTIRHLREEKGLTLRKLASMIEVSPTFMSKTERDEPHAIPSEDKIKQLAKILDQDPDVFLAMAGRVSSELQEIIKEQPKPMAAFLRTAKGKPEEFIAQVIQRVEKDWQAKEAMFTKDAEKQGKNLPEFNTNQRIEKEKHDDQSTHSN